MLEPEFIEQGNTFSVIFKAKEPLYYLRATEEKLGQFTVRQRKIFDLLSKNKRMSPQEILRNLGDLISDRTLRRELSFLKEGGIVDSEGKGSKTTWFLK
jgi:predicted HTH transcriptional regulator